MADFVVWRSTLHAESGQRRDRVVVGAARRDRDVEAVIAVWQRSRSLPLSELHAQPRDLVTEDTWMEAVAANASLGTTR